MANKLYQPLLIESVKATADIEQHRFIGFDGAYCTAGAKALGVSDVSSDFRDVEGAMKFLLKTVSMHQLLF